MFPVLQYSLNIPRHNATISAPHMHIAALERLADHLSREETLADFVADGED